MHNFNNDFFEEMLLDKDEFGNDSISKEIHSKIMMNKDINNYNLLFFACQKTVDLFRCLNKMKEVLGNSNIDSGIMFKQKSEIMFLTAQ